MGTHENEALMKAIEQSKDFIATMTGIKQQFIEAGWTPKSAEQMTHAMLVASTKSQP